jgi:uncharacterized protein (DUF1800 family)
VVESILTSGEFYASAHRDRKVKSPLELVAGMVRASDGEVRRGAEAARLVGDLGQPILRAQPPTGWSETADAVVTAGGMVGRFDAAYRIASGRVAGVRVDTARWARLVQGPNGVDTLTSALLRGPVSATTTAALEQAHAAGATPALLAALVLSSPEFQQQ